MVKKLSLPETLKKVILFMFLVITRKLKKKTKAIKTLL